MRAPEPVAVGSSKPPPTSWQVPHPCEIRYTVYPWVASCHSGVNSQFRRGGAWRTGGLASGIRLRGVVDLLAELGWPSCTAPACSAPSCTECSVRGFVWGNPVLSVGYCWEGDPLGRPKARDRRAPSLACPAAPLRYLLPYSQSVSLVSERFRLKTPFKTVCLPLNYMSVYN